MASHQPPLSSQPDPSRPPRRGTWLGPVTFAVVALLAVAILTSFTRRAPIEELVTWRTDVAQARRDAREAGAPMVVNFTAAWCAPCQRMKATVFSDPQVAELMNERFVAIRVDATVTTEAVAALAGEMGVQGLPTTLIIGPDGRVHERIVGVISPADMTSRLTPLVTDEPSSG